MLCIFDVPIFQVLEKVEEGGEAMSKRAEERANERWPIHPWTILPKEGEHGEIINFDEWLDDYRIWVQSFSTNRGYKEGYEQAEKDTIEKVCEWLKKNATYIHPRTSKETCMINLNALKEAILEDE